MNNFTNIESSHNGIVLTINCDLESILILKNKKSELIKILDGTKRDGSTEKILQIYISKLHKSSVPFSLGSVQKKCFYEICPLFDSFEDLNIKVSTKNFSKLLCGKDVLDKSLFISYQEIMGDKDDFTVVVGSKILDSGSVSFFINSDSFDTKQLKFIFLFEESVEGYRLLGIEYDGVLSLGHLTQSSKQPQPCIESVDLSEISIHGYNMNFSLTEEIEKGDFDFSRALGADIKKKNNEKYLTFCPLNILEILKSAEAHNKDKLLSHIFKIKSLRSWEKIFNKKIEVKNKKEIYEDGGYQEWTNIIINKTEKPSWIDEIISIEGEYKSHEKNCVFSLIDDYFIDQFDENKRYTKNIRLIEPLIFDYSVKLNEFDFDDSLKYYFEFKNCIKNKGPESFLKSYLSLFYIKKGVRRNIPSTYISLYNEDMTDCFLNNPKSINLLFAPVFYSNSDLFLYSGSSCIPKITKLLLEKKMWFCAGEIIDNCVKFRNKLIAMRNEEATDEVNFLRQFELNAKIYNLNLIFRLKNCFPTKVSEIAKDRETFDNYHKYFRHLAQHGLMHDRIVVERIADAAIKFNLADDARDYYQYSLKVATKENKLNIIKRLEKKLAKVDSMTLSMKQV